MAGKLSNEEIALRKFGLDQPGPIRSDDLDQRRVEAGRYAAFLNRMDALDALDPSMLTPKKN